MRYGHKKYDETATILQRRHIFANTSVTGLKLEIIFQEELHAHALSWQAEPSFIEEEAHPTENSLCLSACGRHAEEFPRQFPQGWE